jgi:uncharacterized protein (DUF1800 family)
MRHWWTALGLLLALAMMPARQVEAVVYAMNSDLSGTFYNPAQNGHGFVVQHIVQDGVPAVLVTWFTFSGGQQRWLVGVGQAIGNEARVPLAITTGGQFPPNFNPAAVVSEPWGELVLRMDSKNAGRAIWATSYPGFSSGEMPIQRLTVPASSYEPTTARIAACHTGAWFDPAQSGHGVFLEVLDTAPQRTLLAIWYAYLDGQQRWMTATGPIHGDTAALQANITLGGNFPPNFDPAQVSTQPWGTMTFRAIDADSGQWSWSSTQPGYGSGSMSLVRLTSASGSDCGPRSDGDAARFLTQATFGPTSADIASVRQLGYRAWIEMQKAIPPTLIRPSMEAQIAAEVLTQPRPAQAYNAYRMEYWMQAAMRGPDQLRQRMAFALSQILVISDVGPLATHAIGVAEYQDILVRNALGNYRQLLREVSLSPMMGLFLTHLRNQKTDWTLDRDGNLVPSIVQPDENYAREVMQLFSIGLIERNRDFSPLLINGQTVPTYTQATITDTAKVLTGFSYQCSGPATVGSISLNRNCGACTGTACNFSTTAFFGTPGRYAVPGTVTALTHPDGYRPMACYPRYADTGRAASAENNYAVLPAPNDRKTLVSGVTIGPSPVACHSGTPASDRQACIDYCENQFGTLMDALFLHPNVAPFVSRQLIQRLTTSSPSPGYIDRVAAVFEDDGTGARGNLGAVVTAILMDPEARAPTPAPTFGKLREPILKLTALWRALGAERSSQGSYGLTSPERTLAQRPLGAPSVFNFYEPDYRQPGAIADAGLYSPEFQIINESTFISTADEFWARIFAGYSMPSPTTTTFAVPGNSAYIPTAQLDALPMAHADLVEALNQRLLYGRMSSSLRNRLVALLDGDLAAAEHRRKALNLIHVIAISPEFAVQQ